MKVSAKSLNRSTLSRQLLLGRESLDVDEAVSRVVAIQAQQSASPYIALWNRISDFDPKELDFAFADHRVVKATLMRMTLHAVTTGDYPTFREAIEPSLRASRLGARFTSTGLTLDDADDLVVEILAFTDEPRTAEEVKARVHDLVDAESSSTVWSHLRGYAPILHSPSGHPWTFGHRPSFVAAGKPPVLDSEDASAKGLKRLTLRYLEGFGPASVADIAQFAMVQQSRVRVALQSLSDETEQLEDPDGKTLFDIPGASRPDGETPAPPRLMAMWDSTLLAYKDRSRVIPPDYRRVMIRNNGDILPTLLVDGYVAGVWRAVEEGIEATAFHHLPDDVWNGLAEEAVSLGRFLEDREPRVYSRYNHWWDKLPDIEARLLTYEA